MLWLALALLAASMLGAPSAQAQFPREYRRIILEAVGEFEDGNWAEARALFMRAHELSPNARTLRGIGMCAFEMRDYEDAIRLLQESLDSDVRPLTPRLRQETEDLLHRARSFIGRFVVRLEPPEAQLLIDDAPPEPNEEGQIVLPLGEHTFEASLEGYQTELRRVTVRGGESLEVALTLSPVPETTAELTLPDLTIALLIAAGGTFVVDVFAIGWLIDREVELGTCREPPMGFTCGNQGTLVDQRDAALGTFVATTIVMLGLAGAGLLWWLLQPELEGDEDAEEARLSCGPLGCAGRF